VSGKSSPFEDNVLVRIFVVDDSEIARATIKAVLEQCSEWVVVGEACNGRHALDTYHHHMPHLTVMDFIMPEMNGLEAARHLARVHPDILILLITTDPSFQLEREAKKAGIKGVCAKDQIICLHNAIEALLGGRTYFSDSAVAS
jgi:DNA-binding NarL/FixJ family response regulator